MNSRKVFSEYPVWQPGSFTKNFSWGSGKGLEKLHTAIRIGFSGLLEDIPRDVFRQRLSDFGAPDFIPLNFFLFNYVRDNINYVMADELVYRAIKFVHSEEFDSLALAALHTSFVGNWRGQLDGQSQPSLWAKNYVRDIVSKDLNWQIKRTNSDSIESYIVNDSRYKAKGARKVATNLNHIYKVANANLIGSPRVTKIWIGAVFLILDRLKKSDYISTTNPDQANSILQLEKIGALDVIGPNSLEKRLALKHLVDLHFFAGGLKRFSEQELIEFSKSILTENEYFPPNSNEEILAYHPSNLRINKVLPRICQLLVQKAGFRSLLNSEISEDELNEISQSITKQAIEKLQNSGYADGIDLSDLLNFMRER